MAPATIDVERATRTSRVGLGLAAALVAALAALPFWGSSADMRLMIEFITLLTLAQMWNLLAGYTGLVSIGQQAYIGIGGYALILLADHAGIDPFVSVFLAGIVAAALALPTAALVFRFRGGYFAIGTWVVAEVYYLLVLNSPGIGGGLGHSLQAMRGIARSVREPLTYWIALAVGVVGIALVYLLLRSRRGLALTAIRDSEPASSSLGVNVYRSKLFVYVLASGACGLIGALIYLNLLRVVPDRAFHVDWTAYMIFIVVIGGIGTIEGPILGALLFFVLRESFSAYGTWYLILLGSVAIAVMIVAPQGLWGLIAERFGINFFPVRRRVRLADLDLSLAPDRAAPQSEGKSERIS